MNVLLLLPLILVSAPQTGEFRTDIRPPGSAEVAVEWNRAVLEIAEAEDGFLTLKGLRAVTMMHLAMHDVLVTLGSGYKPYAFRSTSRTAVDPIAAVGQAAFTIAADQYPAQRSRFGEMLERQLLGAGLSGDRSAGIALGEAAARKILEVRAGDGWDNEATYRWHPMGPGVYAEFHEHSGTPEGFVFGAGWGTADPFAMESPDHFRSPPPPEIASAEYVEAFNEVNEVGRFQSVTRTVDQTHLALWWKDFVENSHNRLVRQLVVSEGLGLAEAVRLLALMNMSIFDAYVSSFNNKFVYNHWRPYTAIRWAENDGNEATLAEPGWTNTHRHTYAFPSYPSAHGTACAAAMTVLADTFGDSFAFTMTNRLVDVAGPFSGKIEMRPPTRSFDSFSGAAMECAMSRVYLGIHFRYDSVEGFNLGRRLGGYATSHRLAQTDDARKAD